MHYGIIAAGEGSRLAEEGITVPKPLVELEGRPMIGRLIDLFVSCGAESVSVVVNEQMTEVKRYLDGLQLPVPLHVKVQTTPSSMHTFHVLASMMRDKGRFIATTVDTVFRRDDFAAYARAFAAAPGEIDGMMAVTAYIDDEKPLYVEADPRDRRITAFLDRHEPGIEYVSAGIYGLDGRALRVLDRCMETGVSRMRNFQRALVADGMHLQAWPMGKVMDIDHAADIEKARAFLAE